MGKGEEKKLGTAGGSGEAFTKRDELKRAFRTEFIVMNAILSLIEYDYFQQFMQSKKCHSSSLSTSTLDYNDSSSDEEKKSKDIVQRQSKGRKEKVAMELWRESV